MLLENIFATALCLFLAVAILDFLFNKFRYNFYIQGIYIASGSTLTITTIMWIVRAWG